MGRSHSTALPCIPRTKWKGSGYIQKIAFLNKLKSIPKEPDLRRT
jgi:hypothetical protein